jgi:hypothetical protein
VLVENFVDHLTATVGQTSFTRPRKRHPDQRHRTTVKSRQARRDGVDCAPQSFDDVGRIGGGPFHRRERQDLSVVYVGQCHNAINIRGVG